MASVAHQQVFQARLKRISAGGSNTMSQLYVGDERGTRKKRNNSSDKKRSNRVGRKKAINAFLIGVFSMIIGRLVLFHVVSDDGIYAEQALGEVGVIVATKLGDFSIAAALSLMALLLKKITGQQAVLAVFAGFMLVIIGESRLLQAAPDLYGAIYSPTYAQMQLAEMKSAG